MPVRLPPPVPSALAGALAAGLMLAVAGCGQMLPLGPDQGPAALPPPRHLGSPIIVQEVRSRPPTAAGRCPAGWAPAALPGGPVAHAMRSRPVPVPATGAPVPPPAAPALPAALPCYRAVGTPVTIAFAAISQVATYRSPPGQPKGPAQYGFMVGVPAADVAAVTAVISQAYQSGAAVGISVAGKLWEAPHVQQPFPGRQFQITLPSRNQALRLHRMLVPPR